MPKTARTLPGAVTETVYGGTIAATNPSNVLASDGSYAVWSWPGGVRTGHRLDVSDFGFTVPSDAKIDGVVVHEKIVGSSGLEGRASFGLIVDGTYQELYPPVGDPWGGDHIFSTEETRVYGGPKDMWKCALTPALVNASDFGFGVQYNDVGAASTTSLDALWMTVYYSRPEDRQVYVVSLRDPLTTGAKIEIMPTMLRFGMQLNDSSKCSFGITISHPQIAEIGMMLDEGCMVTVESPDGHLQFCGFVKNYRVDYGDPEVAVQAEDHMLRLRRANTYIPPLIGRAIASGELLSQAIAAMAQRTRLGFGVQHVKAGTPVRHDVQADTGEDLIRDLEEETGWEWGFVHQITRPRVTSEGVWLARLGNDRTGEDVWQAGTHFTNFSYQVDMSKGADTAVVVAGTGEFRERSAVSVGAAGPGVEAFQRQGSGKGFGTTLTEVRTQLLDTSSARVAAQALLDRPENAAEAVSFTVLESAVDRSSVHLGDVRTISFVLLEREYLRRVRVVGLDLLPESGEIGVEAVIVD